MFCPVDLSIILYDRASKASSHFVGLSSYSWFTSLIRTAPLYSTSLFLSSASSDSCLAYFSAILSSLRNWRCGVAKIIVIIIIIIKMSLSFRCPSFTCPMAFCVSCSHSPYRRQPSFICSVSFPPMCRPILTTVSSLHILNTIVLFNICLLSTFVWDSVECSICSSIIILLSIEAKKGTIIHANGRV